MGWNIDYGVGWSMASGGAGEGGTLVAVIRRTLERDAADLAEDMP